MATSGDGSAFEDAALVLDTKTEASRLGLRDLGRIERRLLFRASRAHIEVRVGDPSPDAKEAVWLYGQYVATSGVTADPEDESQTDSARSRPPVGVALVGAALLGGRADETPVGTAGDFALPCDPARPFWLEFREPGAPTIRARFEP